MSSLFIAFNIGSASAMRLLVFNQEVPKELHAGGQQGTGGWSHLHHLSEEGAGPSWPQPEPVLVPEESGLIFTREESCTVWIVKAGNWEQLVEHLVPAFQAGDLMYINIFFRTYRVFTTTKEALDRLFHS
ncbi:ral guanine nucleotide dissociation stimulator-like 1 [Dasypus novemcinctus]|uniref:ral guanine nucleotide dissociation stimulator-like 1 n=1 Tax=Dasypus novemcinctus TaxID=9361 RepID=UPI0039C8E3D5